MAKKALKTVKNDNNSVTLLLDKVTRRYGGIALTRFCLLLFGRCSLGSEVGGDLASDRRPVGR